MWLYGNLSIPDPTDHHVKRRFRLWIILVIYECIMFITAILMYSMTTT